MNRQKELNKESFGLFLIFLFAFFTAFQFFGKSNDYIGYYYIFVRPEKGNVRDKTEPFFMLLRLFNDVLFNSALFPVYLVSALIALNLKWKAVKKLATSHAVIVFFVETLCFFWIHEYTQIRAACAIGIFLFSLTDLINKNYRKYIVKAVVALLFHYSSFTMFVFYYFVRFCKTKKSVMLFPVCGFLFAVLVSQVLGSQLREMIYVIERLSGLNKSGTVSDFMSPFNAKYLMILVGFLLCAFFVREDDVRNFTLCKAVSFGLCIYYWLNPAGLPVISVRLAEFYTSAFVLCFFNCARFIPIKEKAVAYMLPACCSALYALASIRTAIHL